MTTVAPSPVKPSAGYLMDAPLPQLVEELHVDLIEAPITEPGFFGHAYVVGGNVVLALPPNRSELEHDCMARYLIGVAFRVEGLPPLPEQFEVTEVTEWTNEVLRESAGGAM